MNGLRYLAREGIKGWSHARDVGSLATRPLAVQSCAEDDLTRVDAVRVDVCGAQYFCDDAPDGSYGRQQFVSVRLRAFTSAFL